jgi:hypothetical protein
VDGEGLSSHEGGPCDSSVPDDFGRSVVHRKFLEC